MSLFADYIKERENKNIIESDNGFATYSIYDNGECYVQDIFVRSDMRGSKLAASMTNQIAEIARNSDCHTLIGSADINDKNCSKNIKSMIEYGMIVYKTVGTIIFLKKDLGVK